MTNIMPLLVLPQVGQIAVVGAFIVAAVVLDSVTLRRRALREALRKRSGVRRRSRRP
ncbi:hypothetical protein [Compostimonas suwonensis]|uniref:hypothetical protein n=1 Tax=Compostimonas suwonensis TaxID=1048394 RepID=UPI0012FDD411|nr:hypothetical protein [Compostimonas suwonensis]